MILISMIYHFKVLKILFKISMVNQISIRFKINKNRDLLTNKINRDIIINLNLEVFNSLL